MTQVVVGAPGLYLRGRESADTVVTPTAVAGFVGTAQRGPIGVPQPIRSWGEYLDVFGVYVPHGHLAETVFAFFLNGGEKCWVVRAADTRDRSAENPAEQCARVDLLARAVSQPVLDRHGNQTLEIEAINDGSWGNKIVFAIDSESSRDMELTTLRAPVATSDTVLQVESVLDIEPGATIQLSAADDPFVQRRYPVQSVNAANREVTLQVGANETYSTGSIVSGRGFRIEVRYGDDIEVFDHLSMSRDHPRYFPHVINEDADVVGYVERRRRGQSILVRVEHVLDAGSEASRFKPVSTPPPQDTPRKLEGGGDGFTYASVTFPEVGGPNSMQLFAKADDDRGTAAHQLRVEIEPFETVTSLPLPIEAGSPRDRVVVENTAGFEAGEVLGLSFTAADVTLPEQFRTIQSIGTQNRLFVTSPYGADFPIGSRANVPGRIDIVVHRGDDLEPVEHHRNLSLDPADGARWFRTVINTESKLLCADDPGGALGTLSGSARLSGGADPGDIDYRYYTGYDTDGTHFADPGGRPGPIGLAALEDVDEVSLVAVPDLHRVVPNSDFVKAQTDMLHHCAVAGGRFALLDPSPNATAADIGTWPLNFSDDRFAKNGALYFPWVTGAFEDARQLVPPCGFVAGQIADSDRRSGVGKAPANSTVKGVVALAVSVDRELQLRLNPAGVNCIRKFEDGQIRLFGARTLSRNPRFSYINVRRVLLSVVKALSRNLVWAVFEPNDERLQRRIEATLTSYLASLVAKGMTASPRPEDSFYVKCNAENNPSEVRDLGQVIAEIGLAIAEPAEFIVLTARKTPESLSIVEEDA